MLFQKTQYVRIASKIEEDINKAPSIVTVITAKEIEDIGARTLTDILRTVPGFDIIKDAAIGFVEVGTRGVQRSSEGIKVHIDGHSINSPLDGQAFVFFDDLSLKNVKRIEVIRGPGSALYGANAFRAVINIITKDASDIDGIEASVGFGSYDSQEYSIMFGKDLYGLEIAGFAEFYNTNGLSDTIKEDALFASPFLNLFAITPGDTDDSRKKADLNMKLSYKDVKLNAKYMNKDTEPFVGTGFVLTNDSKQQFNYVMCDLKYKHDYLLFGKDVIIRPRLYYDQYDWNLFEEALPDGFLWPFDFDGDGDIERHPNGAVGHVIATNRRLGGEVELEIDLSDNNNVIMGFNYEWERQDNVRNFANFNPLTGGAIGTIENFTDRAKWIKEVTRQIWAIYIQDKWNITDDLDLTIGIRHDHYNDFEGTTNPRIGITWNFMENATLKLLYGQAFRAPAFDELYSTNNGVLLGNPDLEPETIRTYEVGLNYRFRNRVTTSVNYFYNVIRDGIRTRSKSSQEEPQVFENLNGSNIQGVEFEIKADLSSLWDGSYFFANYTYTDAESKGDPLPDVPKHKGNVGINLGLTKHLNANIHAFITGNRVREESDVRDDSPGYALINLTVIAKEFFNNFTVTASLSNLLDKDYNDPAPVNTIPTDLPRPGRTFFIEIGYSF